MIKFVYSKKTTKFCKISTLPLSTVHSDKNKVEISQNFVAFSEYMNFKRWLKASLTLTCFVVPLESILLTFGEEIFQQQSYRSVSYFIKVRTFWEANKNLRNLPHALYIYLVNVQTMRKIFVKFCVLLRKSELYMSLNLILVMHLLTM